MSPPKEHIIHRIRHPIGLRVLIHALRPDDREPFWLWRADPQREADALMERGEHDDRALLWASLLRWDEAERVVAQLSSEGWVLSLHGVRAIVLAQAVALLQPPEPAQGWLLTLGGLGLRVVPEQNDEEGESSIARLLAFLDG